MKSQIHNITVGSGGNYLSNEIFYRIAKARENAHSNVKTGHYHIANSNGKIPYNIEQKYGQQLLSVIPKPYPTYTNEQLIEEVTNMIERALNGL